MLRLMREKAGNWLIKILLGAIVIVFVFWGVGSFSNKGGGRVAIVNGEIITLEEYRKSYNDLMEQLRQRFGNQLNDDILKMLNVKQQALDQIISKRLLLKEASMLNIRVSEEELAYAIRTEEAFQKNGLFDSELYQKVLSRYRLTPEEFESVQKESMLVNKLRALVAGSIKVSDIEAMEWYKWSNESVNIDFVLFEPDAYTDIDPSAEEIKVFFDSQKASYKTEPLIKVRYLNFQPDTYIDNIHIEDEEIMDYYEANPEQFHTPKTVEARHILRQVPQGAPPESVENIRKKALEIMMMAKGGKDFAELAKTYSQGPSKDKGGHIGTFSRQEMVKPFADKAFSMKPGEISEPVRTRFGWHIIKVEKVNEAVDRSFEESKTEIRKKLLAERAGNLALDEAEAVYDASFEGDDLVKTAEARNLKIQTTDYFTKKGPDKGINNSEEFASAAFNLSVMEISDIQNFGNGYYILQMIDKIPEKIPALKDVKDKVRTDLVKNKQEEKAKKEANECLSYLKTGRSLNEAAKTFKMNPTVSGYFKRNDSIPNIGIERDIAEAAFNLSNKNRLPEKVVKGEKGYYVIQLRDRKESDPKGFNKEKEAIKGGLLQQKQLRAFNALLSQLKERSEISIEKGFLE